MAFQNHCYATVWNVDVDRNGRVNVQISTSRKNRNTGEYFTDFSSKYVRFDGDAAEPAKSLSRMDRIKLLSCSVTNGKSKSGDKWNTYFTVFNFEKVDRNNNANNEGVIDDDSNGELPV